MSIRWKIVHVADFLVLVTLSMLAGTNIVLSRGMQISLRLSLVPAHRKWRRGIRFLDHVCHFLFNVWHSVDSALLQSRRGATYPRIVHLTIRAVEPSGECEDSSQIARANLALH